MLLHNFSSIFVKEYVLQSLSGSTLFKKVSAEIQTPRGYGSWIFTLCQDEDPRFCFNVSELYGCVLYIKYSLGFQFILHRMFSLHEKHQYDTVTLSIMQRSLGEKLCGNKPRLRRNVVALLSL